MSLPSSITVGIAHLDGLTVRRLNWLSDLLGNWEGATSARATASCSGDRILRSGSQLLSAACCAALWRFRWIGLLHQTLCSAWPATFKPNWLSARVLSRNGSKNGTILSWRHLLKY